MMSPHLLDAAGDRHPLRPDRTLVGAAEHADVRLPAGSPLYAGVVAPAPGGRWLWHALAAATEVGTGRRLALGDRVALRPGGRVGCGGAEFVFAGGPAPRPAAPPAAVSCHVTITRPDGQTQSLYLDRDLVVGRLPECHVVADLRGVSRMHALFAAHEGSVVVHNLTRGAIGRNRAAVDHSAALADGDRLQLGTLFVDVEIEPIAAPHAPGPGHPVPPVPADEARTDTPASAAEDAPGAALARGARRLEAFLRGYVPGSARPAARGWFGDTAAVARAREAANRGDASAAFAVLDRAVRDNPEGRDLLQALYRFYRENGLTRYCYRPLRHVENLDAAAGRPPDAALLSELARCCALLGPDDPRLFGFALEYWRKVEARTGRDHKRERLEVMALQTMQRGGYTTADGRPA